MAPEVLAAAALRRLVRDIETDAGALQQLAGEVAAVNARPAPLGPEAKAYLAVHLHAWYTGLETILGRIALVVERDVPSGQDSHRELLRDMCLPLPEVRPAVLSAEWQADLGELLSFRHFFRHAYVIALDATKLRANATRLERAHPAVVADLQAFSAVLYEWIEALEAGPK